MTGKWVDERYLAERGGGGCAEFEITGRPKSRNIDVDRRRFSLHLKLMG